MQALEWAIMGKDYVRSAVAIGCGAAHTAWQIAISETQRQAIYADPKWNNGDVDMR
jgi:homoserine O-acetyltransferase